MSAATAPAPRGMQRRSLVLGAAAPLSPASGSALPAAAAPAHSPAAFARRRLSLGESALAAAPRISSDSLATGSSSSSSSSSARTIMPHAATAGTPRGRQLSLTRSPRSDAAPFAAAQQQERHVRRSSIGIASDAPSWLPRGSAVDAAGRPAAAAAKVDVARRYSNSNRTRPQSSAWEYGERQGPKPTAAVLHAAAVLHSGRASQARRPGTADGVRRVGSSSSLLPLQLASPARSGPFGVHQGSPQWTSSTPPASKQTSPSRRFSTSYFNSQAEMQRRSKGESDTSRSDITSSFEDSQYSSGDLSTCSDDRSSATSASISAPSSPADELDASTSKATRKERAPLAPFTARTWMRERDDDDGETFAPHREARQSYMISPSFGQRMRNETLASFYAGDRRGTSPFAAPRDVRVPMTVEGARIIARRASANSMRDAYDVASTSSRSIASRTNGSVTPQSAAAASAFQPAWQFQPPTSKRGSVGSIDSMRETAPVGSPSALFPDVPFRPFPVSRRASGSQRRRSSQGTDTTAEDLRAASKRLHRGSMPQGFGPSSMMADELPPRSGSSMSRRGSMSLEDALAKARAVRRMSGAEESLLAPAPTSTDADLLRALANAPSPPPRAAFSPASRSATPLARETVQKRRASQPTRPSSPAVDPLATSTAPAAAVATAPACTLNFARPFRGFEPGTEGAASGTSSPYVSSTRSLADLPSTPTTRDIVVTRPKLQLAASSPAVPLSSSPSAVSQRVTPMRMLSEPMLASPPPSRSVSPMDTSRPLPSVTASATQPLAHTQAEAHIPLCSTFSRDSARGDVSGSQPISPEKVSRIRRALRRFFGSSAKTPSARGGAGAAEPHSKEAQVQQLAPPTESGIGCIVLAAADDAAAEEYRDWLNRDVRARTGGKKPVNLAHVWKAEMARGGAAPPSALGLATQPASAAWPIAEPPVPATTSKRASKRSSTGSFMRLRAMSLAAPSSSSKAARREAAAPPLPTSPQTQQAQQQKLPKSSSSASLADMARRHSKLRRSSLQSLSSYLRQRT